MDTNKSTIYLDKIFNKYFQEEEEFDKLYLSKRDINKLKESGMEIGLHGHNHLYLGKLYYQDALKDLTTSVEVFKENFPNENLIISYPFGSYNFFTKRIAKQLGIVAGVTITEKVNSDLENLLELNRYDCIKIPPRGSDL